MFAQGFSESPHSMVRFGLFNKINHQGKQRTRPNTDMRLTDARGCPYAARATSDGLASSTCGIQAALGAVVKKDWKLKEVQILPRGNSRAILMCQAARENKSGRRHRRPAREFSRHVGPALVRYVPQHICKATRTASLPPPLGSATGGNLTCRSANDVPAFARPRRPASML